MQRVQGFSVYYFLQQHVNVQLSQQQFQLERKSH